MQWQLPTGMFWDDSKSSLKPIVLFFVEKDDEATRDMIRGPKVAALSKEKANFILVVKPEPVAMPAAEKKATGSVTSGGKSKPAEGASEAPAAEVPASVRSIVPASPLNAADLWKAYSISAAGSAVVADWFGNAKQTFTRTPRESEIVRAIEGVSNLVSQDQKALKGDLEKLESYIAKDDTAKAVKQAVKIFKRGVAGHPEVGTAETHYSKLIEAGRNSMQALETAGDAAGLRALKSTYRDTDIEIEIGDAMNRVAAAAKVAK